MLNKTVLECGALTRTGPDLKYGVRRVRNVTQTDFVHRQNFEKSPVNDDDHHPGTAFQNAAGNGFESSRLTLAWQGSTAVCRRGANPRRHTRRWARDDRRKLPGICYQEMRSGPIMARLIHKRKMTCTPKPNKRRELSGIVLQKNPFP